VSLRGLLALILLLAVAFGTLYWLDHKKKPAEPESKEGPLLRAFTENAVRAIDLTCHGEAVAVRRRPGGFAIERPFTAEADPRRVHELIAALQDARVRKVIDEKPVELSTYGLKEPVCEVKLELDGGVPAIALSLGRSSPVGTERYATAGDTRIVFADGSLYSVASRGAEALREKRLFPVDAESITRIALERPTETLILEKAGDAWKLVAPFADAGGNTAADSLARAVTNLEVSEAGTTQVPEVTRPERRIKVTIGMSNATARIAYVAAAGIGGTRLAWRDGGAFAGLLSEPSAAELTRPASSYRELHVASFSVPDVRSVTIDRAGARLRLSREAEGKPWTGLDGSASFAPDDGRVATLLDQLRAVSASGVAEAKPGSPETATITISGETKQLARLSYGPLPRKEGTDGETLWLTTPSRPGVVFSIPAASLGPIPSRASDLAKEASP
jgi:hypothetical protein